MCQVRQHGNESSAWIVAKQNVYDVTKLLKNHPGGAHCLLKYAGGVKDTYVDLKFHSKKGQRMWSRYLIGTLRECPFEYLKRVNSLDTDSIVGTFIVDKHSHDYAVSGCIIS